MEIEYLGSEQFGAWLSRAVSSVQTSRREAGSGQSGGALVVEGMTELPEGSFDLVIRVLPGGDSETTPELRARPENEIVVLRGPWEEVQLQAALNQAARFKAASTLGRDLVGPFAHDLRGTLGVLALTKQLVAATGGNEMVDRKLGACTLRLEAHIDDLSQLVPTYLGGDDSNQPLESASWAAALSALKDWWEVSHRGVELLTTPHSWPTVQAPAQAPSLLRALADTLARLGQEGSAASLQLSVHENGGGTLTASRALGPDFEQALGACSVSKATEMRREPPYRLRACREWARRNNASVAVEATDALLKVVLELPPTTFASA